MSDLENARKRRKAEMDERREKERQREKEARDTQFAGFAKALWQEIAFTHGDNVQRDVAYNIKVIEELIARRAYDLAFHAIDNSRSNDMEDWETERIMPYVPDMPKLPKEQE